MYLYNLLGQTYQGVQGEGVGTYYFNGGRAKTPLYYQELHIKFLILLTCRLRHCQTIAKPKSHCF